MTAPGPVRGRIIGRCAGVAIRRLAADSAGCPGGPRVTPLEAVVAYRGIAPPGR